MGAAATTADAAARTKRRAKRSRVTAKRAAHKTGVRSTRARNEGMVLVLNDDECVIDIGARDGLKVGDEVRLFRTIRTKHPVTGRAMRDAFVVGRATIVEVAPTMASLLPDQQARRRLRVGDPVRVIPTAEAAPKVVAAGAETKPAPAVEEAPSRPAPVCPPATNDTRTEDVRAAEITFQALLGRQPSERIRMWRDWLRQYPRSPLAGRVRTEIDALNRSALDSQLARQDLKRQAHARKLAQRIYHAQLPQLFVDEPAWIVVTAADWARITDVRVYVRERGEGSYELMRPAASGKLHRRVQVPVRFVRPSGFEYFIDATLRGGDIVRVAGDVRRPVRVQVIDPREGLDPRRPGASTVRWVTEMVDFNRMRGDDRVLAAELDVTYRLQLGPIYAFNMGYGFLNGVGGRVAESDGVVDGKQVIKGDTIDPREASFKYTWLAMEWRLRENWHLITKGIVGLDENGTDTGVELITRIGAEKGTNLKLGVSTLGDMGRAGQIALTTHVIENVPMTGIFEVTNRPVGEELGIRLVYQADLKFNDNFALTGRVGYALRTIDHAGLSLGGGMAFSW